MCFRHVRFRINLAFNDLLNIVLLPDDPILAADNVLHDLPKISPLMDIFSQQRLLINLMKDGIYFGLCQY